MVARDASYGTGTSSLVFLWVQVLLLDSARGRFLDQCIGVAFYLAWTGFSCPGISCLRSSDEKDLEALATTVKATPLRFRRHQKAPAVAGANVFVVVINRPLGSAAGAGLCRRQRRCAGLPAAN